MKIQDLFEKNSHTKYGPAYEKGCQAANMFQDTHGKVKGENPYQENSEEARAWTQGWHDTYVAHVNFDGD